MKLLDLIYVITLTKFSYISIELQLVYDWINCFSLLLNSFIDDKFLMFNGILFKISIDCSQPSIFSYMYLNARI